MYIAIGIGIRKSIGKRVYSDRNPFLWAVPADRLPDRYFNTVPILIPIAIRIALKSFPTAAHRNFKSIKRKDTIYTQIGYCKDGKITGCLMCSRHEMSYLEMNKQDYKWDHMKESLDPTFQLASSTAHLLVRNIKSQIPQINCYRLHIIYNHFEHSLGPICCIVIGPEPNFNSSTRSSNFFYWAWLLKSIGICWLWNGSDPSSSLWPDLVLSMVEISIDLQLISRPPMEFETYLI